MDRRSGRARKIGIILLEVVGALAAIAAGLVILSLWRIQQGPTEMGVAASGAAFAIERALPPRHDAHIRRAVVSRDRTGSAYQLRLEGVEITGPSKARVAELSRIDLAFAPEDVLRGRFGPRSIVIVDPFLRIVRGKDRRLSLDYGQKAGQGPGRNVFRLLTGDKWRGAFERAELRGARLQFADAMSGSTWKATNAEATILRTPTGYDARIDGAFDINGKLASMKASAAFDEKAGRIVASLDVADAPVGDILDMFYGDDAAILTAPVSGSATLTLTRAGEVVASSVSGRAGEGELLFRGTRRGVRSIALDARFDPRSNRFDVSNFAFDSDGSRGRFKGVVGLKFREGERAPAGLSVDLVGDDVVVAAPELFEAPLAAPKLTIGGAYDVGAKRIDITRFRAEILGAVASGSFSYAPGARLKDGVAMTADVRAAVAVDGFIDHKAVVRAWPLDAAKGARTFVADRILAGGVSNIRLDVASPSRLPGAPPPTGAVRLAFNVVDATAVYAPGMTAVTNASGEGRLVDGALKISVPSARVGAVALSKGEVEFTSFRKDAPVHYRFVADGAARDILGVLDEPPLNLLKASNLDPRRFSGEGRMEVDIMRPNRRDVAREAYVVDGAASFRNVGIGELYRGADVADASGSIRIRSNVMNVRAIGKLGRAPVEFAWTERFFSKGRGSRFAVSGVVDSSTGDLFGVPTRQVLRGPVPFRAEADGNPARIQNLNLRLDFSRAALMVPALEWTKPPGAPASAVLDFALSAGSTELRSLAISGEGIDIQAGARFDAVGVVEAAVPVFRIDGTADLALGARRTDSGALNWTVGGRYLNAGPLIESAVGGRNRKEEPKLTIGVDGKIDRIDARAGATFRDVAVHLRQTSGVVDDLSLNATTAAGAPLAVSTTEGTRGRRFEAKSGDVGALLAGLFGVQSVSKGVGALTIDMGELNAAVPRLRGDFAATGVRVVGAPMLARIFAAGSLTGLVDLLNGEGIAIERASGDFEFHRGVLTLRNAKASGPSVGLTAQGSMTAGGGPVDLVGAVAPAYQLNSMLGAAPVIGKLLVGRQGEGVVALSYDVKGRSDAPTVTVDPLSALTPGILRRIFETDPPSRPSEPPAAPQP